MWGRRKWLYQNRRRLFCGSLSSSKRRGARYARNALLESLAQREGGGQRHPRARARCSRIVIGKPAGFARVRRSERLRRFEKDEPAAARIDQLRLALVHRR